MKETYIINHFSYTCDFCSKGQAGVELIESFLCFSFDFMINKIKEIILDLDKNRNNIFKRKTMKLQQLLHYSNNLGLKVQYCEHGCYYCFLYGTASIVSPLRSQLKKNSFHEKDKETKIDLTKKDY
jgi:hypothetical protein